MAVHVLDHFLQQVISEPCSEERKYDLLQICEFVLSHNARVIEKAIGQTTDGKYDTWKSRKERRFSDAVLGKVVRASTMLQNLDLFLRVPLWVGDRLPLKTFTDVGRLVRMYGFEPLRTA